MKRIDLGDFLTGNAAMFAGRDRGAECRAKAKLDELDQKDAATVEVAVPDQVLTITSSFFQAMFGDSVRKLGAEGFKERYRFSASPRIIAKVEEGVHEALILSSVLISVPPRIAGS